MNKAYILVIDGNDSDQFLAERLIKKFDASIKVFKALTLQDALTLLGTGLRPGLIFLDAAMDRMDGYSFLDHYIEKQYDIPVFIVSSFNDFLTGPQKQEYLKHDCVKGFYDKPLHSALVQEIFGTV